MWKWVVKQEKLPECFGWNVTERKRVRATEGRWFCRWSTCRRRRRSEAAVWSTLLINTLHYFIGCSSSSRAHWPAFCLNFSPESVKWLLTSRMWVCASWTSCANRHWQTRKGRLWSRSITLLSSWRTAAIGNWQVNCVSRRWEDAAAVAVRC